MVLLDEIEKAHPDIFNILLQIMDAARLTDNNGRETDFRNVILIMTSNAGAQDMAANVVGFGKGVDLSRGKTAIEKLFPPEFRNRLDGILLFNPLKPAVMGRIVEKFVKELAEQLREKSVVIELSPAARDHLAKQGYDERLGARPLARVIQQQIKQPLANEILFGALEKGGTAMVDAKDGALVFEFASHDNEDED